MAYESVYNGTKQFLIDWDVVRRLLRSYWTACLQYNYGQEVTMSDSHWYNPMSWALPDVSHVEVDWDALRRDVQNDADGDLREMRERAKFDAASVAKELDGRIDEAARYKELFLDWMGDCQTKNMHNINKAVDDYQSAVDVAKFVRDTSADGLMVGASVMSGGAAVGFMGAGSFLKGEAKFQDTGSVGAGVMEGAGSFVFAYVKLGKNFSFKEDMVLALVQAPYKGGTELVGGATLSEAALSGALKLTGPSVDRLFRIGPAKSLFDKVAVPIVITYEGKNVASAFLSKFAAKMVQSRGIEKAGKKMLLNLGSSPKEDGVTSNDQLRRPGRLIDETTITNKYLLYLAYVNMDNGIGRGW